MPTKRKGKLIRNINLQSFKIVCRWKRQTLTSLVHTPYKPEVRWRKFSSRGAKCCSTCTSFSLLCWWLLPLPLWQLFISVSTAIPLLSCHNKITSTYNYLHVPHSRQSSQKISNYPPFIKGTAVAQWLRRYATNRKVAGSIQDDVNGIFHWHNPSDRTMDLGSTQPLTEMSTRRISRGSMRPVRKADNLTTFLCRHEICEP
jgi:hypothetical protein